ncbi:PREDICTED: uncharacterized protein LOC106814251 [Priapulus caudatus]|uniref:Uncharacterized protein LOC106814251 n=1 Tax=Priapulus caudatus TaxID=37621 RepID=A0ABM1EPB3_PRICU|nr:PREDICTED: uncharacterized protein LOC106814251 [Priapulus caudatus]
MKVLYKLACHDPEFHQLYMNTLVAWGKCFCADYSTVPFHWKLDCADAQFWLEHCSFKDLCCHFKLLLGDVGSHVCTDAQRSLDQLSRGNNFAVWEDIKTEVQQYSGS